MEWGLPIPLSAGCEGFCENQKVNQNPEKKPRPTKPHKTKPKKPQQNKKKKCTKKTPPKKKTQPKSQDTFQSTFEPVLPHPAAKWGCEWAQKYRHPAALRAGGRLVPCPWPCPRRGLPVPRVGRTAPALGSGMSIGPQPWARPPALPVPWDWGNSRPASPGIVILANSLFNYMPLSFWYLVVCFCFFSHVL